MIFRIISIGLLATLFTSCSNDFDLTEPPREIPVVYGLISAADTTQYIRVEKAFIDENIPANVLAMDPANLYFENLDVKIRHNRTGTEYNLTKVDGNTVGLQRSPGAFAQAPNFVYKLASKTNPLTAKDEYTLILRKPDGTTLSTATTRLLAKYENTDVTTPGVNSLIGFTYNGDFRIVWAADENAAIHDIQLIMHYVEERPGMPVERRSITWHMARNYDRSTFSIRGREFYEFLARNMDANPNVARYFEHFSLSITSGGKEIRDYISVGQANTGITSSGEIPTYSNLSNGGLGVFSSKSQFLRTNIGATPPTIDSLKNGFITKSLNFR